MSGTATSATILVVEDEDTVAESIRDVLVGAGYAVTGIAATGAAALALAKTVRPDLVLMDVQLQGPIDGIDTANQLRDESGIRCVYLTGATDDATLQRAKRSAPLGYLKKPFNARELHIAVEIALHQASLAAALAAREQWFATTLQSIGDAVLTIDGDDRVTFLNRAAASIIGIAESHALGKKVDEVACFVDSRGAAVPPPTLRAALSTGAVALPSDARLATSVVAPGDESATGRSASVPIEGSIAPIVLDGGKALGTVMVFRDVGERRQLERRLGRNERLAAIGTMAEGMQHEINNPLAAVVANIQFSLESARANPGGLSREETAEIVSALQEASEGAERVRRTVEDLRQFSRGEVRDAPIELTAAIEEALKMTVHAVRHHATVKREYGEAPKVDAEEGQLARVFMNLLLNAAQAVGEGNAAQHTIVLRTRTDALGRAVAEVADDGPGMPPDMLVRIFDPFFTTPLESASLGLGLAVCHRIVTSLGGEIDVESEAGAGTTFRVTLPAATTPGAARGRPSLLTSAPLPAKPSTEAARAAARARILVIDDELAIGNAIRRILGEDYDVTVESDALSALERLGSETYDVVFCDLAMPNMSGMEFFEQLSARAPQLAERVVFLTGGAFSPRSEEFLRNNRNPCIAKPFSGETLSSIVSRMSRVSRSVEP